MGMVTVPGSQGKEMAIALEVVRPSIQPDTSTATVQEAINMLDDTITDLIDDFESSQQGVPVQNDPHIPLKPDLIESGTTGEPVYAENGDRIKVYWPLDDSFYPGVE